MQCDARGTENPSRLALEARKGPRQHCLAQSDDPLTDPRLNRSSKLGRLLERTNR